jgi:5-methylcytosine-specific restriction endonuclease McrA
MLAIAPRDVDTYRARQRVNYAAHAEARIAKVHEYQTANRDRIKAYRQANSQRRAAQAKAWREAHPEQVKANRRAHYTANTEAMRAYGRRYYEQNREQQLASLKAWREANPQLVKAQWARKAIRRRIREKLAFVETIDPQAVFDRDGGTCQICRTPVERLKMTLDHIVSLKNGGKHTLTNVQLAHRLCNSRKGSS